ncbi:hypothetical protein ASL14_19075 [Paenibacillus sp. IHB B 3084]|uniref:hypothetical protein n=1 Tax=Paenibacillus sp. IHB B 3084 TaxID=867076 RepID=UPI000720A2EE|nr:hypothetical protein [Paenibacillus sp. IHB B 3084]ALP37976.1 hypothetical protein ASL14_19075 [Paenibacillus sp. IHB B 3084]
MVEDLIKYYEETVSDYGLVYKHMKWLRCLSNISVVAFILTTMGLLFGGIYVTLTGTIMYWPFIPFFVVLGITLIISHYHGVRASKIVKTEYGIYSRKDEGWKTEKYKAKQLSLLVGYLERNDLDETHRVEKLIQRITDLGKSKIPPLVAPGLLLAFLVPLWNHLIPLIYAVVGLSKNSLVELLLGAFLISAYVAIILFSSRIIYRYIFKFREEIFSEMFRAKSRTRDELITLLEDVLLKL